MKISNIFLTALFSMFVFSTAGIKADDDLKLKFGAYADIYFANDNDNIKGETGTESTLMRQFTFTNLYKNEFRLNIAQVSGIMDYKGIIRGNVTVQYGDFAHISHSGNPIQQAFVGYSLAENLWLDAGYFLTHIGGEAVLPKDNWLSTHSLVTYHEPFIHSGIKLTYAGKSFQAGFHILNGSLITFEDNNFNKTIGLNLGYSFGSIFSASYAGLFGNEEPGSPNNAKLSMYHNFCFYSDPIDGLSLKAQFDYATREKGFSENGEVKDASLMGLSLQGRVRIMEKLFTTLRVAYVDNTTNYSTAYNTTGMGLDLGVEYKPSPTSYIRLEGGMLKFDDTDEYFGKYFRDADGKQTDSRMDVRLTFGFWID